MITLEDIFEDLQNGELSQFSISGDIDGDDSIRLEDYPAVISHINRGLTALHTRFALKEREVIIEYSDGIQLYRLDYAHAVSNTESTETKYILDSTFEPFQDDVLRVEQLFDELGAPIPINDSNLEESAFLTDYKTIQIMAPVVGSVMSAIYRANHVKLDTSTTDLGSTEVDIPVYCVEPLLAYVAARVYARSSDQVLQSMSSNFMAKYELLCQELEKRNILHNTPNDTNVRIEDDGWV